MNFSIQSAFCAFAPSKLPTDLAVLHEWIALSTRGYNIHTEVLQIRNLICDSAECEAGVDLAGIAGAALCGSCRNTGRIAAHDREAAERSNLCAPNCFGLHQLVASFEIGVLDKRRIRLRR